MASASEVGHAKNIANLTARICPQKCLVLKKVYIFILNPKID